MGGADRIISSWEIQPCKTQRPGACFAAHTPQSPDQSASKKKEQALLKEYIDIAPREDFRDILDAIDRFVYFDNRKKGGPA